MLWQAAKAIRTFQTPNLERRRRLLLTIERHTELPLLLIAFLMVPLLAGPFIWDLSSTEQSLLSALSLIIWSTFAIDLGVKTLIVPERIAYLRNHWVGRSHRVGAVLPSAQGPAFIRLWF